MRCSFDRSRLGGSNAVPTTSNGLMVRRRGVPKVQNVRNFWGISTPQPRSTWRFPNFCTNPKIKNASVAVSIQNHVRSKVLVIGFPTPGQPHLQDSWFKSYEAFKCLFHLKIHSILLLFKAISSKNANHGQRKTRSNLFGPTLVFNQEPSGCRWPGVGKSTTSTSKLR